MTQQLTTSNYYTSKESAKQYLHFVKKMFERKRVYAERVEKNE